jgi:hypothetical protein
MTRSEKEKKIVGSAHVCEKKKSVREIEKETGKEKSVERKEKRKKETETDQNTDQEVHGCIVVPVVVAVARGEAAGIRIITEGMQRVVRIEESE